MIKLCRNLFYKPKYGSDADSFMLKRLFSTVTAILVCLSAISFSAYAFFSYSVTSGTNTIKASSFSTTLTIKGSDDKIITQGSIQNYTFQPGKYTVTITKDSDATGTGFCVVTVGDTHYYTQQLGKDLNAPGGERNEISFVLDVPATITVSFASRWGTTSYYNSAVQTEFYIKNSDPLQVVAINATQSIADNTEETTPKETTPEETTQTPSDPEQTELIHTVVEGENLTWIANAYKTTPEAIAEYNGLEDLRTIQIGQQLKIPPADGSLSEDTTEATTTPTEATDPAASTGDA